MDYRLVSIFQKIKQKIKVEKPYSLHCQRSESILKKADSLMRFILCYIYGLPVKRRASHLVNKCGCNGFIKLSSVVKRANMSTSN